MTIEQKIKQIIADQIFVIASLSVELEEARSKIAELEAKKVKGAGPRLRR